MKVKIGDKVYDSLKQPIMLILSNEEKDLIRNMPESLRKFCSYPEGLTKEIIRDFMRYPK